ncbi:MAG: M48 family metalloprotease [Vicinamibacterales bacterium]
MANEDKATRYQRLRRRASLAGVGAAGLVLGLALLAGLPEPAAGEPGADPISGFLALVPVALGLLLACLAAAFPAAFYRDALLTRRYGVLREPPAAWARAWARQAAVSAALGVGAILGAALLRWVLPGWWWLAGGAVAGVAPFAVGALVGRVARQSPAGTPLRNGALRDRLARLAAKAGLPDLALYQTNVGGRTRLANAAVVTAGGERRVLLSDTLLADHADEEVEVVVAHELGHVVHRHGAVSQAVRAAHVAASLYGADAGLRWLAPGDAVVAPALLPAALLAAGAVYLALRPLPLAVSRLQERSADRYAITLSGNPAALASVVRRLAANNLAEPSPSRLVLWFFHSHPPVSRRLSAAAGVSEGGA